MTGPVRHPLGIIGNLNVDIFIGPAPDLVWDQEVLAGGLELRVAGTAGYLALAANALGMEPVVVSALGTDHLSQFLLDQLKANGISTRGIAALPSADSPVTVALVRGDGKRSLVTVLGAHEHIDLDFYRSHLTTLAEAGEIFLCGTYLLPHLGPEAATQIARESREQGQQVIFDPSWDPEGFPSQTRRSTYALLAHVDVFMPNEDELCALTGEPDWRKAIAEVGGLAREVVVKRGPHGAAALVEGTLYQAEGLPVVARDTTGAGDVFDVGYLWARRQGWAPVRRLRFANALAALVVEQDRRSRYPSLEEALQRMNQSDSGTGSQG